MNPNDYLGKSYPTPPCWELVRDVYATELGLPVTEFRTINSSVRAIAATFEAGVRKNPDGFAQIGEPVDMCVVLLSKLPSVGIQHAGIYVDGRVLHALETGVVFQDMATLGDLYRHMEFWARPLA